MPIPTTYYPWATSDLTQNITVNGVPKVINNKREPAPAIKGRGILYDEGFPLDYWNYILSGSSLWFQHLDERIIVGDVFETKNDLSASQVGNQLSGSWELLGTKDVDGTTIYVWRRIT